MGQLTAQHPNYQAMVDVYMFMRDSYLGSDVIKLAGTKYLPATASMILDGQGSNNTKAVGNVNYNGYRERARYPEYVREGSHSMVGMMNDEPTVFTLPASMQYLLTSASPFGEPLEMVLQKIHLAQLIYGKGGILVDMSSVEATNLKPYLAVYNGLNITNWNDNTFASNYEDLNMVVLTECSHLFNPETFTWTEETKYRLLTSMNGVYQQGLFTEDDEIGENSNLITPHVNGEPLQTLPFVPFTDKDLTTDSPMPPLKWLADSCKGIYQSEADYRQNLYMQGQDTLVVKNSASRSNDDDIRTGSGAVIHVDGQDGDAKYIGVSSAGLQEQREAIENDRQEASYRAGQFIGTKQAAQESGQAMSTRIGARTTTLSDIADAAAAALQKALRLIAVWLGEDPDSVTVVPNKSFLQQTLSGQDLVQIVTARNIGAPVSLQSLHTYCADHGLTRMSFDDEMAIIKKEVPGTVTPLTQQIDASTGKQVGTSNGVDPNIPEPGKQNVDSRP